jgi:hypothetical protein
MSTSDSSHAYISAAMHGQTDVHIHATLAARIPAARYRQHAGMR